MDEGPQPRLKFLHAEAALVSSKLDLFSRAGTQELMQSLLPGKDGALKVREDGTVIDGHHRLNILQDRGIDIDSLPREVIRKHDLE